MNRKKNRRKSPEEYLKKKSRLSSYQPSTVCGQSLEQYAHQMPTHIHGANERNFQAAVRGSEGRLSQVNNPSEVIVIEDSDSENEEVSHIFNSSNAAQHQQVSSYTEESDDEEEAILKIIKQHLLKQQTLEQKVKEKEEKVIDILSDSEEEPDDTSKKTLKTTESIMLLPPLQCTPKSDHDTLRSCAERKQDCEGSILYRRSDFVIPKNVHYYNTNDNNGSVEMHSQNITDKINTPSYSTICSNNSNMNNIRTSRNSRAFNTTANNDNNISINNNNNLHNNAENKTNSSTVYTLYHRMPNHNNTNDSLSKNNISYRNKSAFNFDDMSLTLHDIEAKMYFMEVDPYPPHLAQKQKRGHWRDHDETEDWEHRDIYTKRRKFGGVMWEKISTVQNENIEMVDINGEGSMFNIRNRKHKAHDGKRRWTAIIRQKQRRRNLF